jgi:hypothetical protein
VIRTPDLSRARGTLYLPELKAHVPADGAAGFAGEPLSDRLLMFPLWSCLRCTEPVTEGLAWSAPKGDAPPAPTSGLRVQLSAPQLKESNPDQEVWKLLCYHYTKLEGVLPFSCRTRKPPFPGFPGAAVGVLKIAFR